MIKLAFTAARRNLNTLIYASFALPKHELLSMPALSPTMKEGKIVKWLVKEGDKVQPGDAIAEVQTDKATVAFEVQEKGFIAKINADAELIPIGTPVAVLTKKSDQISQFSNFNFKDSNNQTESLKQTQQTPKNQSRASLESTAKSYPPHTYLQMPAVSPTMNEGKILKWKIQPGESFGVGDALFSIETDKAVVDYQATEKGVLAKVIANENQTLPIGKNVAVIVKNKDLVPKFADFKQGQAATSQPASQKTQAIKQTKKQQTQTQKNEAASPQRSSGDRVIASPLAKFIANQKGIDLSKLSGSGPGGRILKQDVESFTPKKAQKVESVKSQQKVQQKVEQKVEKKAPKKGFVAPENPFEDIALSNMRKTIANRLSESKQNIPHYYVSTSIEMGKINDLRNELNKNEKEHGVKISVNDIIIKAIALGLRDVPNANVQWHGTTIRKFKHADVSVAVATEGGLITPIVYKADTLGLLDIARRTKDIAKRAREGKLDPNEYIGGTTTVSNLGMFGINTVTSIINPPQATILGVGKTQKKLVFAEGPQPYRVAEMMDVIASCDHRAVDGALAAQWLNRIKYYLQNPTHMLL